MDAWLKLLCRDRPSFGTSIWWHGGNFRQKKENLFPTPVSLCHTCCIPPVTQRRLHKYALQFDSASYKLVLVIYLYKDEILSC